MSQKLLKKIRKKGSSVFKFNKPFDFTVRSKSGLPLASEDLKHFKEVYQERFDFIWNNRNTSGDTMFQVQEKIANLYEDLIKDYETFKVHKVSNMDDLRQLLISYGHNILLVINANNLSLEGLVDDEGNY